MRTNGIVALLILLSVLFTSACDHSGPTAPSPSPVPSSPVPVPPVPVTDVWNITVRLSTVAGGECVAETMQSQIGVPKSYSLSTVSKGSTVDVTSEAHRVITPARSRQEQRAMVSRPLV
jgi:hypothetical protein